MRRDPIAGALTQMIPAIKPMLVKKLDAWLADKTADELDELLASVIGQLAALRSDDAAALVAHAHGMMPLGDYLDRRGRQADGERDGEGST